MHTKAVESLRDRSILALMQLADSNLPIGRFAHSGGIEALARAHGDLNADSLREWVEVSLLFGAARVDGVAVAHAHASCAKGTSSDLRALDRHVDAHKLADGVRRASASCGRQLAALGGRLVAADPFAAYGEAVRSRATPGHLSVVSGALAAALGLSQEEAVLMEMRGIASAQLSAAVRLGCITAVQAQILLHELGACLLDAARDALSRSLDQMSSSAFELEITVMDMRLLDGRLFAT